MSVDQNSVDPCWSLIISLRGPFAQLSPLCRAHTCNDLWVWFVLWLRFLLWLWWLLWPLLFCGSGLFCGWGPFVDLPIFVVLVPLAYGSGCFVAVSSGAAVVN